MQRQVRAGRDPASFFPELMWLRSLVDWTPKSIVVSPKGEHARALMFVTPSSPVPLRERREEDYRRLIGDYLASLGLTPPWQT